MAAHGQYEYDVMDGHEERKHVGAFGSDNVDDCGNEHVWAFGSDIVDDCIEEHVGAFGSDNELLHHDGNKDQLQRCCEHA